LTVCLFDCKLPALACRVCAVGRAARFFFASAVEGCGRFMLSGLVEGWVVVAGLVWGYGPGDSMCDLTRGVLGLVGRGLGWGLL
jgi:hypothetical protein